MIALFQLLKYWLLIFEDFLKAKNLILKLSVVSIFFMETLFTVRIISPFVIIWSGVRLSPPAPETKLLVYESLRPTLTVVQ